MSEYPGKQNLELPVLKVIKSLTPVSQPADIQQVLTEAKLSYCVPKQYWWHNASNNKSFFLGNEHDNIYVFLKVKDSLRHDQKPLTIVNFDEHIDDSLYSVFDEINGIGLNASWQKYVVDIGYTDREHSFNILPEKKVFQDSQFTQEMSIESFIQKMSALPKIDVLSVDLDFFNKLQPNSKRWSKVIALLKHCLKKTSSLMLFTSPVFSTHLRGVDIAKELFTEMLV